MARPCCRQFIGKLSVGKGLEATIRKVEKGDIEKLHAIADSMLLDVHSGLDAEQQGFLISNFSLEDYRRFVVDAEYFYLAESDGNVCGFLLAYDSGSIKDSETVNKLLEKNIIDPFVLIKQIVVLPEYAGKGVAGKLYEKLFSMVPDKGVAAAIVTEPYNLRSVRFHKKYHFQHLCNINPPPDPDDVVRMRSIWYRGPAGKEDMLPDTRLDAVDRKQEASLLIEKLHAAISLYTHEDNLNWTKLGMLITFMMALLAAFSYLLEKEASGINLFISSMLIGFGFLLNVMFYVKISSGLMFMQSHKEKARAIECKLSGLYPGFISVINVMNNQHIAGRSITAPLLRLMPIVSLLIWVMCSIILIHKEISFQL